MLNNVYGGQNERLTEHRVEMTRTTSLAGFEKGRLCSRLGWCGLEHWVFRFWFFSQALMSALHTLFPSCFWQGPKFKQVY